MTHAQTVVLSALVVALGVVLVVALVLDGLREKDESRRPTRRSDGGVRR